MSATAILSLAAKGRERVSPTVQGSKPIRKKSTPVPFLQFRPPLAWLKLTWPGSVRNLEPPTLMTDPTLHDFLVEHAKFPFPECLIDDSASSTGLSEVDVGLLDDQWKARHAVRDKDLANKLCVSLRTTLGHTPVTELSRSCMLRWLLPEILGGGGDRVDRDWLRNLNEVDVSVILLHRESKSRLIFWGQSRRLLDFGVFKAAADCLFRYDQSDFEIRLQQRVEGTRTVVDFHALVDDKLVAVVEAESPTMMIKLGELLPQNAFKIRWTTGSTSLVSLLFSKAGV